MTLQAPSYVPFMEYSTNRELKEKLWRASNSLCLGGEFDNTENIKRMVNLRLKIANLLGYPTYADYVLADRMAENAQTVNAFLDELLAQTKEYAVKDYNTIGEYAARRVSKARSCPGIWLITRRSTAMRNTSSTRSW